jgi:glucose-6-phosphate isomerase
MAGAGKWFERCEKFTFVDGDSGFQINFAGMKFADNDLKKLAPKFAAAHKGMKDIEAGKIKNPDEKRKVTHFTDRMAYPNSPLFKEVEKFAADVRSGKLKGSTGEKFEYAVINGIGGSALGPQLIQFAVNGPYWNELSSKARKGNLRIYFLDNTDTAGLADALNVVELEKTLIVHISKSGGTQETKNNMIAAEAAYKKAGLPFNKHSAAITMKAANWTSSHAEPSSSAFSRWPSPSADAPARRASSATSRRFSRASTSRPCSRAPATWTSSPESQLEANPAYMLAAMWYIAGNGKGDRNMVIVPYSDRLVLLSRYMQSWSWRASARSSTWTASRSTRASTSSATRAAPTRTPSSSSSTTAATTSSPPSSR